MAARVLYVHHRAEISGAARSLAGLLRNLGDDWEPHVLTPRGPVVQLFKAAGASVTTAPVTLFQHTWDSRYAGRKWLLLGREAVALPPHAIALRRLIDRYRFKIVHLNDSPLLVSALVAKRAGVPVVWHLRSALSSQGSLAPRLVRTIIEQTGEVAIAIDSDVRRSFALRTPTVVVFNSVDVPVKMRSRSEARDKMGVRDGVVAIGFIGNLRRVKGWMQFVEAAALLRDEATHFVVLGGGVRPPSFYRSPYGRVVKTLGLTNDDEAELRRLVSDLGMEGRFSFVPFTDHVEDVYAGLDIVAFPNTGEGLGRPVLEAAAFGIPTVASGSPDGAGVLLPDRTGVLLGHQTGPALANALRALVRDPSRRARMADAALAHARERFDSERNAFRVRCIYGEILGAGRDPDT
jgi:glycosyltransferase involved in cell wall biosynthesis